MASDPIDQRLNRSRIGDDTLLSEELIDIAQRWITESAGAKHLSERPRVEHVQKVLGAPAKAMRVDERAEQASEQKRRARGEAYPRAQILDRTR